MNKDGKNYSYSVKGFVPILYLEYFAICWNRSITGASDIMPIFRQQVISEQIYSSLTTTTILPEFFICKPHQPSSLPENTHQRLRMDIRTWSVYIYGLKHRFPSSRILFN